MAILTTTSPLHGVIGAIQMSPMTIVNGDHYWRHRLWGAPMAPLVGIAIGTIGPPLTPFVVAIAPMAPCPILSDTFADEFDILVTRFISFFQNLTIG
jgi:hypothetical protein